MLKPDLHPGEIPEFERRVSGELRRARSARPRLGLAQVNRPHSEFGVRAAPRLHVLPAAESRLSYPSGRRWLPLYLAIIAVLFLVAAGVLIWRLTLPKAIVGVFPAYEAEEPRPAAIQPPVYERATVTHRTRKGETFLAIAQRLGLSESDLNSISAAAKTLPKEYHLGGKFPAGRLMNFQFNSAGELRQLVWQPEASREVILRRAKNGNFAAKVQSLSGAIREHVAVGTIESSFAAAAQEAGVAYDVVDELVDLFSNRIEFSKDFQRGDRFTVIYRTPVLRDGTPIGDPQILAAALEVKGQHLVATRYVGSDGKARYFDEKANLLGNSFLRYPLKFSRISSYFTEARFHPVLKVSRPHNGIDFAAPTGTPVRTVAEGYVVFAGYRGGNGNMVKIRHNDRYSTAYLHLSSIAKGIKTGAHVQRGQLIGAVGMTGLATGPHLHFSFYDGEKYVNPLKTMLPMLESLEGGTKIDEDYLKKVLFTLQHYQNVTLSKFYSGEE